MSANVFCAFCGKAGCKSRLLYLSNPGIKSLSYICQNCVADALDYFEKVTKLGLFKI